MDLWGPENKCSHSLVYLSLSLSVLLSSFSQAASTQPRHASSLEQCIPLNCNFILSFPFISKLLGRRLYSCFPHFLPIYVLCPQAYKAPGTWWGALWFCEDLSDVSAEAAFYGVCRGSLTAFCSVQCYLSRALPFDSTGFSLSPGLPGHGLSSQLSSSLFSFTKTYSSFAWSWTLSHSWSDVQMKKQMTLMVEQAYLFYMKKKFVWILTCLGISLTLFRSSF